MTVMDETQSLSNGLAPQGTLGLGGRIGDAVAPLRERMTGMDVKSLVVPTIAMSAACLAVVTVASAIERGSPWAGINAISAGLGLSSRRPAARFQPVTSLVGLGTIAVGSLVIAGLHSRIAPRVGGGIVGRGLLASLTGVTLDKLLMREQIFGAFKNALGVKGTVAKYAAIGLAAALASRR